MAQNRVFFPRAALDEWMDDDKVELSRQELVIREEGRRYRVAEAVRVLAEVTGGGDAHALVGRVKTLGYLSELGAEVMNTSMILGDLAYDVVPGFVGVPVGAFSDHLTGDTRREAQGGSVRARAAIHPQNDEDLLVQFLLKNLD